MLIQSFYNQFYIQMKDYTNLWNVVQCGIGFLVLFIAYNSAINLQVTVMQQSGFEQLGFYNLALISIVCGFSCLLAPFVIKRVGGVSRSLVIGAFGNFAFILASVLPALKRQHPESSLFIFSNWFIYLIMILTGIICGFGQGLLWTSQGYYISQCAQPVEQNKGLYFSLFWSTYMLSQIFGNLLAAFIIDQLN